MDLLDGTPVVDIKPYIPSYDCPQDPMIETTIAESSGISCYSSESNLSAVAANSVINPKWTSLGTEQSLTVSFTKAALSQIKLFSLDATDPEYQLKYFKSFEEAKKGFIFFNNNNNNNNVKSYFKKPPRNRRHFKRRP